jgi:hypothetical protein
MWNYYLGKPISQSSVQLKPIGVYKTLLWFVDDKPIYHDTPIYGRRKHFLELAKKWANQVLIVCLDDYMWINE